jgi:hypothetical protein
LPCAENASMANNSLIKVVKHIFLRKITKFHFSKSFQSPGINFFLSLVCGK